MILMKIDRERELDRVRQRELDRERDRYRERDSERGSEHEMVRLLRETTVYRKRDQYVPQ